MQFDFFEFLADKLYEYRVEHADDMRSDVEVVHEMLVEAFEKPADGGGPLADILVVEMGDNTSKDDLRGIALDFVRVLQSPYN